MLSADDDENKPAGKVSQRKAKAQGNKTKAEGKKSEPRKQKEAQSSIPKPDQLLDALQRLATQGDDPVVAPILEQASAPFASTESFSTETLLPEASLPDAPLPDAPLPDAPLPDASLPVTALPEDRLPEMSPVAAPVHAETTPVSLQTIADAYGEYSKKWIEQTSTFFANLANARSLPKAFELQTAFAREAYETFVAESRKIRDLHRELAKQRLMRLEGFVMGMGTTRSR
jgi:hypothetical protein